MKLSRRFWTGCWAIAVAAAVAGCGGGGGGGGGIAATDYSTGNAPQSPLSCDALMSESIAGGKITATESVAAGAVISGAGTAVAPAGFCRVKVTLVPATPESDIKLEIWMPPAQKWNGKFLGTGNGGYAGAIRYVPLVDGIQHGYAVANTDTGSHADQTPDGFRSMIGKPELQINYVHRGVHLMTVAAKEIIARHYARPAEKNLFSGCSAGGFEAVQEATRYPNDYDGIIAGAGAYEFAAGGFMQGAVHVATQGTPGANIPAAKLPGIRAAVLGQCDSNDGLVDGLITDPRQCKVDVDALVCTGAESDACLTAPQATALKKIYAGASNPRTGAPYYYGFAPGAEASGGASIRISNQLVGGSSVTSASPGPLAWLLGEAFKPSDWLTFDFDVRASQILAEYQTLAQETFDLRRYKELGGKLILYHGLADATSFPNASIDAFERVQRKVGATETQQFARLFLAPGMDHCAGGYGPNDFGQTVASSNPTPSNDIVQALDRWVTAGVPPERLVAAKYVNNNRAAGLERSRPLCAFPLQAKHVGGDVNNSENFVCGAP